MSPEPSCPSTAGPAWATEMRVLAGVEELVAARYEELGRSEWLLVDQARLDMFRTAAGATATANDLVLALIPLLSQQIWRLTGLTFAVNAGTNRVRFPAPIEIGCRVQLRSTVVSVRPMAGGARLVLRETVYDDRQPEPVVAAETVTLLRC